MSEIEEAVKNLNALRSELDKLESGMRKMRLGGGVEMRFKRFFWRDMVIAYGWGHQKSEPLPEGIESEFYGFLAAKARTIGQAIRDSEKRLAQTTLGSVR